MAENALIVGAGQGLSAALARLFRAEGMHVTLAARDTDKLAPLATPLSARTLACDASDPAQVAAAFEALDRHGAAPDVVVYNPSRRVPGTLRVRVVEREPAGLVPGREGMTVVDCDAQPLPYDPARAGVLLPIVERADTAFTRALCLVRAGDAQLYELVDAVRRGSGGSVMLEAGRQRIWLTRTPTLADVHAVAMVRRHLEATGRSAAELDARYRGLVYARRERT